MEPTEAEARRSPRGERAKGRRQTLGGRNTVIGKAEVTPQRDNPCFVVTNLSARGWEEEDGSARFTPAPLYEVLYCARGESENVLKQQVLDLQTDRMSTHHLVSN